MDDPNHRWLVQNAGLAPEAAARMPAPLAAWLVEELRRWASKKSNAEDYKRLLRHYGGGGMEWYDTKDEIDAAREELDDLRAHVPKFAEGDLGRWKETYEKWLSGKR